MTLADDMRAIVARLRGWGFNIREESGCYERNNGTSFQNGRPDGHGNHHYVCALNPSQSYIDGLVSNLKSGNTVNWFADMNGRGYLIGVGPMNHFGTGNSSVLSRTKNDQAPTGAASSSGDMSGNQNYSGTECQHPGDATPWPEQMLKIMVAINAAEFLQWKFTANRGINHFEWTNRKIDMSAWGGPSNSPASGNELRKRIAAQMGGSSDDDEVTDDDIKAIATKVWSYMVGAGGAGVTLEEVRSTNRDMNAKLSKLVDPRNGNVNGTG